MAIDTKYGKVGTEFGDIGEDEPVVVFRGRDALLPMVLRLYAAAAIEYEAIPEHHLELIHMTHTRITRWQGEHNDEVHLPNSNAFLARVRAGEQECPDPDCERDHSREGNGHSKPEPGEDGEPSAGLPTYKITGQTEEERRKQIEDAIEDATARLGLSNPISRGRPDLAVAEEMARQSQREEGSD